MAVLLDQVITTCNRFPYSIISASSYCTYVNSGLLTLLCVYSDMLRMQPTTVHSPKTWPVPPFQICCAVTRLCDAETFMDVLGSHRVSVIGFVSSSLTHLYLLVLDSTARSSLSEELS